MGAVHRLDTGRAVPSLADATTTFLSSIRNRNTRRSHATAACALAGEFGPDVPVSVFETEDGADRLAALFEERWGDSAPNTAATRYDGWRAVFAYWEKQNWIAPGVEPLRRIGRPKRSEGLDRAWSRERMEELLTRRDLPLRERLLYTMLYETAARVEEVLPLNVEDLDRADRQAPVTRKGGKEDWIVWQSRTAVLLPRYLKGRTRGPLLLTDRKAKSNAKLSAADIDPASGRARLSYNRTAELWKVHGDPDDGIHLIRHTALTHAAEDGMNTPMLKRKSGHSSVTSLARYSRPSVAALRRWNEDRDPGRRGKR